MSASKKDFEAVAASIRQVRGMYPDEVAQNALNAVVVYLCHDFAAMNPRFDAERFRKACEVSDG